MIRSNFRLCVCAAILLGCGSWLRAHSMYQGSLLLDFRGASVDVELQLPAERVHSALATQNIEPLDAEERVRVAEYIQRNISASLLDGRAFEADLRDLPQISRVEGAPYVVAHLRLLPPAGARADAFDLRCGVLLDRIPSQVILVSIRTDWKPARSRMIPNY